MRDLTEQELLANYGRSYTNAATDFSDAEAKFPAAYLEGDLKEGDVPLEEYAAKRYFKNL